MRLRALFAAAAVGGVALVAVTAPSASAYCDPKYHPACTNDCWMQPPPSDPDDLRDWLFRICPA